MGKKPLRADPASVASCTGVDAFAKAVRKQLVDKNRVIRAFDIGGSGVKTGLFSAVALAKLFEQENGEHDSQELEWIEPPQQLGSAPGEHGFDAWLLEALPRLNRETKDANVCFGVSIGGDVDHRTSVLNDWWPGGGHPREWDDGRANPLVADLMGLPAERTFPIHDGEAHLLGACRRVTPPPNLGCLAIGTGVGFGITDSDGAIVDPCRPSGERSLCLNGVPLSGAPYRGTWQHWLNQVGADTASAEEVMERDFANMSKPWRTPWVSLVLGRRGIELAEAVHRCSPPLLDGQGEQDGAAEKAAEREPAARAFASQWLHFLHTQFIPQFVAGSRRHVVERICFAGGVAEHNWDMFHEVLIDQQSVSSDTEKCELLLRSAGADAASEADAGKRSGGRRAKSARVPQARLVVMPLAPNGSGLIGAGLYALAGIGGGAQGIWAP
eukprot:TRINITY_DN63531_c0_g1_i1.p1 TRINITY_DN63531_c0_g1~~TRINITY_DN63531_c0_g1_i1.p1  ORF type:complete len:441 (-),score=71.83 TRINITY_DN63531_c0_g1_i1:218-1540(-)